MVEECNKQAAGRYRIVYRVLPRGADDQRVQLARRMAAGDTEMDVLALDVTWTPEFASAEWILEWTGAHQAAAAQGTLAGPLETATYQGKLFAAPKNTNVQLLWYRTDLVDRPPATWAEMIDMALALKDGGRTHQVLTMGAQYEGLVVLYNTLVASAGGRIRDATFTLLALLQAGYREEAVAWREWLLRAVAGRADQMQIMYGVQGERRLTELELDWLPGYAGSRPVRIGNAAHTQHQLDVYGELMDAFHQARSFGIAPDENTWVMQRALLNFLESRWHEPDEGIWEVRGPRQHYTHSKVMAWVAADRAVKAVQRFGLDGPVDRWKRLQRTIFDEVCERGYDAEQNTFVQHYGSDQVDAALLLLAPVGFLPPNDKRILGTVAAVESRLCRDGLVHRYDPTVSIDTLPPGEGAFLACTFWLADNYILQSRRDEAKALVDKLLGLRTDLGLLAEQYDTQQHRMVGNFPQALSHIALIDTAVDLADSHGPSHRRAEQDETG